MRCFLRLTWMLSAGRPQSALAHPAMTSLLSTGVWISDLHCQHVRLHEHGLSKGKSRSPGSPGICFFTTQPEMLSCIRGRPYRTISALILQKPQCRSGSAGALLASASSMVPYKHACNKAPSGDPLLVLPSSAPGARPPALPPCAGLLWHHAHRCSHWAALGHTPLHLLAL